MSVSYDMDPVERIAVGAVGEPGQRTFYLQARRGETLVSLVVEKGQVAALAEQIDELLDRLDEEAPGPEEDVEPSAVELEAPIVDDFRVGPIGIGYDADRDLVLLQCEELVRGEEEDDQPPAAGAVARFWAGRGQMRALARRGHEVVAAGRPTCRMCGSAIDPEGHFCPASNGHKQTDGFG